MDWLQEASKQPKPPGRGGWGAATGSVSGQDYPLLLGNPSLQELSLSPPTASSCTWEFCGLFFLAVLLRVWIRVVFFFMLCLPFSYHIASFDSNKNQNKWAERAFLLQLKQEETEGHMLAIGSGTDWIQKCVLFFSFFVVTVSLYSDQNNIFVLIQLLQQPEKLGKQVQKRIPKFPKGKCWGRR